MGAESVHRGLPSNLSGWDHGCRSRTEEGEAGRVGELNVERVACDVCPRRCELAEGAWGFCDVRSARQGSVKDMYQSAIAAPGIELRWGEDIPWGFSGMRKGRILEVYLPGCNLKCNFCVAPYLINLGEIRGIEWIEAGDLVRAVAGGIDALLFSGGEASIHVDYVADVFSQCQARGVLTCLETNGYMTRKTAETLAERSKYVVVGLKASLDQAYYRRKLGVKETQPIFDAMKVFAERGCELMLTDVTDPTLWDDTQAFKALTEWIARNLGPSTRLVLAPLEKIEPLRPWTDEQVYVTPREPREAHIQQYQNIAVDAGLHRVFRQENVRKRAEEYRERLEKTGLFSALQKLGMTPP